MTFQAESEPVFFPDDPKPTDGRALKTEACQPTSDQVSRLVNGNRNHKHEGHDENEKE